jgi:hypothetical protein
VCLVHWLVMHALTAVQVGSGYLNDWDFRNAFKKD